MPKQNVATLQETAYAAAVEAAPRNGVGSIVDTIDEGDGVTTFLFEAKLKGYVGWRWSITVFEQADSAAATISEVLLMPGPDSLVAPDWVPWSERLADYKALQAELEAQAALDAAEAEDADDEDDEDEDLDESDEAVLDEVDADEAEASADEISQVDAEVAEDESVLADLEEGEDAEGDAKQTGRKPPRFFGRRKRAAKKDARGKGKNPKN
ncbi:MAG: hypothetical protein RI987_606 [Actinomycetota bacterium]|jgi:Protein of unknown function (DUF3027)